MSVAFSRTLRSLNADGMRPSLVAVGIAVAFVTAWSVWFFVAEVGVFEVTSEARIEAGGAAHVVEAPTSGRVTAVDMKVDQEVAAGHPLVILETNRETSRVQEETARVVSLGQRIQALQAERDAEIEVAANARNSDAQRLATAAARHREALAATRLAESQLERSSELAAGGLAAQADLEVAVATVEKRRAEADALSSELDRHKWQREQEDAEHLVRLAEIDQMSAAARGELAIAEAAVQRVDHDLGQRVIRSPIAGRLGEILPLRPGTVVAEGERVAVVIPGGELMIVARFPVASALGRIRSGQQARLRLDAFPWTQFGELEAEVRRVASEASDGRIRVELALVDPPDTGGATLAQRVSADGAVIPLQHGLSGTLVVLVEKVSPADLTLRAAGRRFQGSRARPDENRP